MKPELGELIQSSAGQGTRCTKYLLVLVMVAIGKKSVKSRLVLPLQLTLQSRCATFVFSILPYTTDVAVPLESGHFEASLEEVLDTNEAGGTYSL